MYFSSSQNSNTSVQKCLQYYQHTRMGLRGLLANDPPALARVQGKLQALLYDMLPSTTAVFSYTIGSENCQPTSSFCCCCCWYSSSSKFVTNNSNYIRRLFYVAMLLTPAQIKPKPFETRRNFFFLLFYTGWIRLMFTCVRPVHKPFQSATADFVQFQRRRQRPHVSQSRTWPVPAGNNRFQTARSSLL